MIQWAQQMTAKLPRFYCFWTGPFRPSVLLNHPDTVSTLLRTAGIYLYSCSWHQFVLMIPHVHGDRIATLSIRNICLNDGRGRIF